MHLHLLFEIQFLILLVSFIFCLRLYFYLSLNNDTYVIMSIESDIYVFICMSFVLVELFDEWVYGLC